MAKKNRKRALAAGMCTLMAAGSIPFGALTVEAAPEDVVTVMVNGMDVENAAKNMNGLTFKGFGVLSGNSTSSLLMDYKAEHPDKYWELIETLFGGENPIMNQVKIEMGNDRNTSTGPNVATMRTEDEYPNVKREPGFQLAADAKKVNPDLKVSILRWCSPTWVKDNDDVYKWYKNTILAAYREYGYMVNTVNPGVNEKSADLNWTKTFSERVENDEEGFISDDENRGFQSEEEKELFHQIQTIISDEVGIGSFGNSMTSDEELRDAVDIAAYHYNTDDDKNGNFKKLAENYDKEIWNSEAQATFSNSADRPNNNIEGSDRPSGVGGNGSALEMGNTIIKGFVNSRRTHFIYQPGIASFYEGYQYSHKELISARDPWSGWVYYDAAVSILEHFSQFANTGWSEDDADVWRAIPEASDCTVTGTNPVRGARDGQRSYMTMAAPDKSDFSTVIINDSKYVKNYKIQAKDMDLGDDKTMEIWQTTSADAGEGYSANYKKCIGEVQPDSDGNYTVTVQPWSIVTATTLDRADEVGTPKEGYGQDVPVSTEGSRTVLDSDSTGKAQNTEDGFLYADDFEYKEEGNIQTLENGQLVDSGESYIESRGGEQSATPRYTSDTNGAFEVYKTADGNHVMRQQVGPGMAGSAWNGGDPITAIGDYRWTNYKASTDVTFEDYDGQAPYASIGAREMSGNNAIGASAYELKVWADGGWALRHYGNVVKQGSIGDLEQMGVNFKTGANQTNNIAIQAAGDTAKAYINGVEVASYTDSTPQSSGRIQIGTSFNFVQFDNLKVETVDGYVPYFADVLDDLHMTSWDNNSEQKLVYNEKWNNSLAGGMFEYNRTTSKSTGKGATLGYTFQGTGLDLIGKNNGKATLNVTVDGEQVALKAATTSSGDQQTTYRLRGLANGQHTVVFETADDNSILIDTVGVVTANAKSVNLDLTALKALVDESASLTKEDYSEGTWSLYEANLNAAKAAVADQAGYGLDAEGLQGLTNRLQTAREGLKDVNVSDEIQELGFVKSAVVKEKGLPEKLIVKDQEVKVTWNAKSIEAVSNAEDYSKVNVTGVTEAFKDGLKYEVKAEVEVIPKDVVYFIDSGVSEDSPEYLAVKEASPELKNDKVDQESTDGTVWGYNPAGVKVKSGMDINDKLATGIYQDKDEMIYYLPLDAGEYVLTAGYKEWWSMTRPMKQELIFKGEDGSEQKVESNIDLSGSNNSVISSLPVVKLTEAQTVTLKVTKTGSERPVISWLAVKAVNRADKEALKDLYAQNENKDEQDYSKESWTAFQDAMTKAEEIIGKTNATQEETDAAFAALQAAADGLQKVERADKQALKNMVATVEALNEVDYSKTTWQALQDRLTIAKSLLEDENASQEAVDAAYSELVKAFNALEAGLNTSAAEVMAKEAEDVLQEADKYRPSDVEAISAKLQDLKTLMAADSTTQEQLDQATLALQNALMNLREQVDASRLQKVVDLALELLENKDNYTADSVAKLEAALQAAQEVLENENRTQEQVGNVYADLTDAIAAMQISGKKDVLLPLLERANEILADSSRYTAQSLKGLKEATDAAQAVYDNANALQQEVNNVASKLAAELAEVRILGDVNNDGKVDTSDAAKVLKANAELEELEEDNTAAADVNRDGTVDTNDVSVIQKYAAEMITEY